MRQTTARAHRRRWLPMGLAALGTMSALRWGVGLDLPALGVLALAGAVTFLAGMGLGWIETLDDNKGAHDADRDPGQN